MSFGFPSLAKIWNVTPNLVASDASADTRAAKLFVALKGALTGWACLGSSDGTTGALDAVDRISNQTKIVVATSGAHSWFAATQTATALQVVWDWKVDHAYKLTVAVSMSAGFTGGSVTARPTASDEIVIVNQEAWTPTTVTGRIVAHVVNSSDGENTRVVAFEAGVRVGFWELGAAGSPVVPWTVPIIAHVNRQPLSDDNGTGMLRYTADDTTQKFWTKLPGGVTAPLRVCLPGAKIFNFTPYNAKHFVIEGHGSRAYSHGSHWPTHEAGLVSATGGSVGLHGKLVDLYATGVGTQRYVYANGSVPLFNANGWLIPWQLGVTGQVS